MSRSSILTFRLSHTVVSKCHDLYVMTMKLTVLRSIFYVMHEDDERSLATMIFRLLHSVYIAEELTARCDAEICSLFI